MLKKALLSAGFAAVIVAALLSAFPSTSQLNAGSAAPDGARAEAFARLDAVPEPAMLTLLGASLLGLSGAARRRLEKSRTQEATKA